MSWVPHAAAHPVNAGPLGADDAGAVRRALRAGRKLLPTLRAPGTNGSEPASMVSGGLLTTDQKGDRG
jgi:hypothetical protein